jgi:FkbM family methyltransferase
MRFTIGSKHFVCSLKGRRKVLVFDFAHERFLKKIFDEIFMERIYDRGLGKRKFTIDKYDTVIDIGANAGFFSVYAANLAYRGKVYSFEPEKENFSSLIHHIKINRIDNVIPVDKGVSDSEKEMCLYLSKKNRGAHSFYREKIRDLEHESAADHQVVQCVSLKSIFDAYRIKRCDFLKIDAEGEEYAIIEALPVEYLNSINKIAMEYHPVPGKDIYRIADRLDEYGFGAVLFQWKKDFGKLYAYKRRP